MGRGSALYCPCVLLVVSGIGGGSSARFTCVGTHISLRLKAKYLGLHGECRFANLAHIREPSLS